MARPKFGINDILNAKSRTAGAGTVSGYTEIWLSPYEVKPSENNFYSQENIEELADSFLAVGQQQPTALGRVDGEFRIVSGHRRNLANIMNIERGHKEYEKVRYLYKDMSAAMFELSLLIGNAYNRELTAWEKTQQAQKLKEALLRAKKEDGLEITGKLRDVIADLLNESSTNVARMNAINNNATPEVKEQLRNGNMGITAAYEAAKLSPEEQKSIAGKAAAGGDVRAKEIAEKVAEKKECNVKTGTCKKCDQYINKAEAEKTEEQRYSEEQDGIDRETRRKLRERADGEKMDKLSGERGGQHKRHEVKIAASHYDDVASGKKSFELRKNDRGYKVGDRLKMLEFIDGKHTGRTIDADIVYMLEEYTGLQEGYCILGINVTAHSQEVSETDTGERR